MGVLKKFLILFDFVTSTSGVASEYWVPG